MITRAWRGDWYERLKERVRARGFETVTAYADAQPTVSLLALAKQLTQERDIAALQIELVLLDEADSAGMVERCARDLLVRNLHEELPEGWHTQWNDDTQYRRAGVFSSWYATLGSRYEPAVDSIFAAFVAAPIPEGWLPDGPDDPILVEIFQKHWREPEPEDDTLAVARTMRAR
jgi:hypothetical protein